MKILRWISVLPLSFLAFMATYYIYRTGFAIVGENPDTIINRMFLAFICPLVFMYIGVKVAPSHKKQTALVLATIIILLSIISLILNFRFDEFFSIVSVIVMYFATKDDGLEI